MPDSSAQIFIDEVAATALDSAEQLKTVALNTFDVWWNNDDGAIVPPVTLPIDAVSSWTPIQLPDIPDFTLQTVFEDLAGIDPQTSYVWDTTGEQKVYDAIWNIINEQGIGLSQSLQDSIFNSDRERKLQALRDGMLEIAAKYASRGFRYPSSIVANAQNELVLKYQMDLENQSREITKLMEEHARQNLQFAVQQGIDFEKFHSDFALKYAQLFVDLQKAAVELYVSKVNAELTVYKTQIEAIATKVQLSKTEADYLATMGRLSLDNQLAILQKYATDVTQENYRFQGTLEEYKADFNHKLKALESYAAVATGVMQSVGNNYLEVVRG